MAVTAARAHRLLKGLDEVERYLKFARSKRRSYAPGYAAMEMLSFDQRDYPAAIEVLQDGLEEVRGSGELHYFLSLAHFYKGDVDRAKRRAQSAQALDYPLTGLARKIARHQTSAVNSGE